MAKPSEKEVDPPDTEEEGDDDEDEDDDAEDGDEDDDEDEDEEEGEMTAEKVARDVAIALRDALENQDSVDYDKRRVLLALDDDTRWVLTVKRREP